MRNYAASRLASVKASASAAISQKAKALQAEGRDVIDLGLGEPDFDTPVHVVEGAHTAAQAGQTRYPPTSGTAALKQAVRAKFARDNGLDFGNDQIIVSNGAKQVIFDALMATLEPGDEVILAAPYFDSYRNMVGLLGGVCRTVHTRPEDGFRLRPADLQAAITDRTRWLILNTPSNPAGAAYDRADIAALGAVLKDHPQVLILSDEIYEHILFDGAAHVSIAAICPELADRILTVNGVSKAYAMTGWRIGYGAGPAGLIRAMETVQSQISSGACSVAQAAAVTALNGQQDGVATFREAFERRRNLVAAAIDQIDGLNLVTPRGAFYALIDCRAFIGGADGFADDVAFVDFLLERAGVAAVPGSVYEMPGHFRISTACADDTLKTALERIAAAVAPALTK